MFAFLFYDDPSKFMPFLLLAPLRRPLVLVLWRTTTTKDRNKFIIVHTPYSVHSQIASSASTSPQHGTFPNESFHSGPNSSPINWLSRDVGPCNAYDNPHNLPFSESNGRGCLSAGRRYRFMPGYLLSSHRTNINSRGRYAKHGYYAGFSLPSTASSE
jgi:hypothetical protein